MAKTPIVLLLAAVTTAASAQPDPGREAFLRWARTAVHPVGGLEFDRPPADLAALGRMIGGATVVAVSEGVHAGAEPLEFRNRLVRYLVEHHGFTAIAIESGLTEGRTAHDWVAGAGAESDLPTALARGITWTFDRLPQNADLMKWMRAWNADPRHGKKLDFYGFDLPGSPGNPYANRGMHTALDETLAFLDRVDTAAARTFHQRLDRYLPDIQLDSRSDTARQYPRLGSPERDAVTAAIADLITLLERRERPYREASSPNDYAWAWRNAQNARSVDGWLRRIPLGWKPAQGMSFFAEATDVRDRAQADNVGWILERLGPGAKLVIFASRYHISAAPMGTPLNRGGAPNEVAGTYLRRRLGPALVTIGNLIGKGRYGCTGFAGDVDPSPPESIDGAVGALGLPLAALDIRTAPPPVRAWLDRPMSLGGGRDAMETVPGKAFDILLYMESVRPACPK